MAKYVMLIDTKRCVGCHTCAMACKQENNLSSGVWWNQVYTGSIQDFSEHKKMYNACRVTEDIHLKMDVATGTSLTSGVTNTPSARKLEMNYYTKACQHCNKPACLDVCPTAAIFTDVITGAVDIDFSKCIGCGSCITACPYDARHLNQNEAYFGSDIGGRGIHKHINNTVEKCTFCNHRLAQGKEPVCVESCLAGARYFGNISDPSSKVYQLLKTRDSGQLLPENNTEPSIYYLK